MTDDPKNFVANYELNNYKYSDFWKTREYEHRAEVNLLEKLFATYLPDMGERNIVDLGGAFGRLTYLYAPKAKEVVLADYSTHELSEGMKNMQEAPYKEKVRFLALNAYKLPLSDNSIDSLLSVRVMHHLKEMPIFISELQRILTPGGIAIIEFANKNHIVSLIKHLVSFDFSFASQGVMQVSHNSESSQGIQSGQVSIMYNFSPAYIKKTAEEAGLEVLGMYGCSFFRSTFLKRLLGTQVLLGIEKFMQSLLGKLTITPSVFIVLKKKGEFVASNYSLESSLVCPICHSDVNNGEKSLRCVKNHNFPQEKNGIIDLRDPRPETVTF